MVSDGALKSVMPNLDGTYARFSFYKSPNWEIVKKYNSISEEVVKQLDILLILKRINFIEKSLSFLFTDHQLKGLHLAITP